MARPTGESRESRAQWSPELRSPYLRGLVAYALVVGLCVAVALAWFRDRERARSRDGRPDQA
ncbi:hypothetical protein M8Z33_34870 [Streptomyces sp. ZAF1911]|uniref:hypothetical protein n=1 Tax=Streptomyces sp. ZAF1911 TaxID=2944129 RepID=UPI00237ABBC4|nr:hypothetical protein [Streptomyces sp. ZAF1911]MDD9381745.1 hypothetical protein [Streptomyces sp. ZAF1911]